MNSLTPRLEQIIQIGIEVKKLRKKLEICLKSRNIALAITKLEEAEHRLKDEVEDILKDNAPGT